MVGEQACVGEGGREGSGEGWEGDGGREESGEEREGEEAVGREGSGEEEEIVGKGGIGRRMGG